ncbi:transmembrane protein 121B-like [Schistocerca americana]|uniref:transmembrane protein 121B-like n=1 Tax=Schistocerca americana TaxID=7009 RepID=UPI001F504067|nr:transmembrane protein 121B-like [Schistocerca americana]
MAVPSEASCCSVPRRMIFHVLDAVFLITILILQGTILNYYIIKHSKHHVTPYFWFIADIASLFIFAGTLTVSYQYLTKVKSDFDTDTFFLSPKRILHRKFPTSKLGIMPLSYVSWIIYSTFHFSKVAVIFKSGIPDHLKADDFLGNQALQITIALSGIIFILLAEGHNWSTRQSPRYLYVTSVGWKTGIEILDTVNLLALLLVNETKMILTYTLENSVLIVCSFNFFLPALALYKLSLSDMNHVRLFLPLNVLYNVLHLCLIDIPFLAIRIYIWVNYNKNASIFLMKNVFGIIMVLRSAYPDLHELFQRRYASKLSSNQGHNRATKEDISLHVLNADGNNLLHEVQSR